MAKITQLVTDREVDKALTQTDWVLADAIDSLSELRVTLLRCRDEVPLGKRRQFTEALKYISSLPLDRTTLNAIICAARCLRAQYERAA